MADMHARGGMNVCMGWDFDTGKCLLNAEFTHKSLYDMVITLFTGYLFIPTEYLAPFKALLHFDVELFIIMSSVLLNI